MEKNVNLKKEELFNLTFALDIASKQYAQTAEEFKEGEKGYFATLANDFKMLRIKLLGADNIHIEWES